MCTVSVNISCNTNVLNLLIMVAKKCQKTAEIVLTGFKMVPNGLALDGSGDKHQNQQFQARDPRWYLETPVDQMTSLKQLKRSYWGEKVVPVYCHELQCPGSLRYLLELHRRSGPIES